MSAASAGRIKRPGLSSGRIADGTVPTIGNARETCRHGAPVGSAPRAASRKCTDRGARSDLLPRTHPHRDLGVEHSVAGGIFHSDVRDALCAAADIADFIEDGLPAHAS